MNSKDGIKSALLDVHNLYGIYYVDGIKSTLLQNFAKEEKEQSQKVVFEIV